MDQKAFDIVSFILSILLYSLLVSLVLFGSKVQLGKNDSKSSFEIFLIQKDEIDTTMQPEKPSQTEQKPPKTQPPKPIKTAPEKPKKSPKPPQSTPNTKDHISPNNQISNKQPQSSTQNMTYTLGEDNEIFKMLKYEISKNAIYPRAARRAGLTGVVGVGFDIGPNGIKNEKILQPSKHKSLNEAALNAVKTAKPNLEKIDKKYSISMEIMFELR